MMYKFTIVAIFNFIFLVSLFNTLSAQQGSVESPRALRSDIQIEHYMDVAEQSIRLIQDPTSKDMYYNTVDGDIYRIVEQGKDELLFTMDDHGIPRLQGMAIHKNDLFLSGNIESNNGLGSKGIVMRGSLQPSGDRMWTRMAITVEHGAAQTAFNHGFNATIVSKDEKYLLVNSGARTDHGEVQHNRDNYPNQRDVPTTAVIIKLPIDGQDILLTHDEQQMQRYTFVQGVRNIYDMAYDSNGHLFGVSNSSDYDHSEDMFWLREGHHYGFPWIIGGTENPQQYPFFQPDPDVYHLLPETAHAYQVGYFRNDPDFPKKPVDLEITPSVQNIGPHANYFRDQGTGEILDGDQVGKAVSTFSAHRSPLGLVFDQDSLLNKEFVGDGFVIGYSSLQGGMGRPFGGAEFGVQEGRDMLHLKMFYSKDYDNYITQVTRIVDNFVNPTDALMIENEIYVITHSRSGPGQIWKIILPNK